MIEKLKCCGEVLLNASLKNYNTYRVDATVGILVKPNSINDLVETVKILQDNDKRYFILGNGSNVVLNDDLSDYVVIVLEKLNGFQVYPEMEMAYAEAGVMLPLFALETVKAGLTGMEFAAGIPGTIGGSLAGNAGAYNSCIMDYVISITILDENFEVKVLKHEEILYGYRTSMFKENRNYIILGAKFFLKHGDKDNSLGLIEERKIRRSEAQPLNYPSAGSVFRNPEGDFAGRLIEECGFKGMELGGAKVSEKHANFIVNFNNATGNDIKTLIEEIRGGVRYKTNVSLLVEQEFIGWE